MYMVNLAMFHPWFLPVLVALVNSAGAEYMDDALDYEPDAQSLGRAVLQQRRQTVTKKWFWGKQTAIDKGKKIVIIGAGPAGIHMASRLKHLGYNSVTVLEKTDRVGGKSFTLYRDVDGKPCVQKPNTDGVMDTETCVAREMGTCFLHNAYHHVRWLLEEYGLKSVVPPLGRAILWPEAFPNKPMEISEFIVAGIKELVKTGHVRLNKFLPEEDAVMLALIKAMRKYNTLFYEYFGNVKFTMPDRPSKSVLEKIEKTFEAWMQDNGVHALIPLASIAQKAQGYGSVKTIPAYYGLVWMKPELLAAFMQQSLHNNLEDMLHRVVENRDGLLSWFVHRQIRRFTELLVGGGAAAVSRLTTMMPEGYAKLWNRIYEKDQLNVSFNVEIEDKGIQRRPDGTVSIKYSENGGPPIDNEYDYLIYTAPHALAEKYMDLTTAEQKIFQRLSYFVLMTTFYRSEPVAGYSTEDSGKSGMYNYNALDGGKEDDGMWYGDRDDHRIFAGAMARHGKQWRVAYQFYEKPCEHNPAMCNLTTVFPMEDYPFKDFQQPEELDRLTRDLQAWGSDLSLAEQFPWPYFWHFSESAISEGKPWDLFDMQGEKSTFWLGASAVFESVHDVVNYNLQVLDEHFGGTFYGDGDFLKDP
mmetsp:Transcript_82512/g.163871  ORF Transcript_82512/g.163871 Transcript_82512/m.163871 type:complete len:639 (-) Transcript_82512:59-1975(-)